MRTFPKFLKAMPTFYGLVPVDLIGLAVGLCVSMIFELSPLLALILSGGLIGCSKWIRSRFDFVGFLVPSKKQITLKGGNFHDSSL